MRARALAASLALLGLCACSKPAPPPAPAVQLDCSVPFETLKARILAQPGIDRAPQNPGEPYVTASRHDVHASYFITRPGAPGHPAILMQQVGAHGQMVNTGCPYGDKAAYAQLMAYLTGLKPGAGRTAAK